MIQQWLISKARATAGGCNRTGMYALARPALASRVLTEQSLHHAVVLGKQAQAGCMRLLIHCILAGWRPCCSNVPDGSLTMVAQKVCPHPATLPVSIDTSTACRRFKPSLLYNSMNVLQAGALQQSRPRCGLSWHHSSGKRFVPYALRHSSARFCTWHTMHAMNEQL